MPRIISVLCVLLAFGCGDSDKNNIANNSRMPTDDMTLPDEGADISFEDQDEDSGVEEEVGPIDPNDCLAAMDFESTIVIDSEGRSGQFYSTAAFDGLGVWVAYTAPYKADVSDEGIFVTQLGCDGSVIVPPQMVSPNAEARNYMPVIDSRHGRTVVLWVHQPNSGNEKFTYFQAFGRGGQPLFDAPVDVTPKIEEQSISETAWSPAIAVGRDIFYHVAEALGPDTQVVVQRIGWDGEVRDVFFASEEKDVNQRYPSVAAMADGGAVVSWTREPEMGAEKTYYTRIAARATAGTQAQPAQAMGNPNPLAVLAPAPTPSGDAFLAFQSTTNNASQILVRNVAEGATAVHTVFGASNFINFRPTLRSSSQGGALAWYRYTNSPQRNAVVLQPFSYVNGAFTQDEVVVVLASFQAIPPYGPGLTPVAPNAWFVTWTQGDSAPDARVLGRFVRGGGL